MDQSDSGALNFQQKVLRDGAQPFLSDGEEKGEGDKCTHGPTGIEARLSIFWNFWMNKKSNRDTVHVMEDFLPSVSPSEFGEGDPKEEVYVPK